MDHKAQLSVYDVVKSCSLKPLLDRVRSICRYIRASPLRRIAFKRVQARRIQDQADRDVEESRQTLINAIVDDFDEGEDDDDDDDDEAYQAPFYDGHKCIVPQTPDDYRKLRKRMRVEQGKPWMLIQEVKTRWMTIHSMVLRFVILYEDICIFAIGGGFNAFEDYDELVTSEEWRILQALSDALHPLADFVRIAEGERYVTTSWIPPMYCHVLNCLEPSPVDDCRVARFKQELAESLKRRLGYLVERPNLALAACALHPSFARLEFVGSNVRSGTRELLKQTCNEYGSLISKDDNRRADVGTMEDPIAWITSPEYDEDEGWKLLKQALKSLRRATRSGISLAESIDLAGRPMHCPLRFWREIKKTGGYDKIMHVPKIVFSVQGTSAASERVFSGIKFYREVELDVYSMT